MRTRDEQTETAEEREGAKAEAELSVAPRLLRQVAQQVSGRLISGDALYCHKALCRQIRQAGGDYLFAVKANQPDLLDDLALLFRLPPPGERFLSARTVDKHGGRLEIRHLRASATLAAYLRTAGWPDAGLALAVETTVRWPRHPARPARHEERFFLSSLLAHTQPVDLLTFVRRHWHIENRLHWPRDVTLGEDACQVRSGHAPQALASVRNAVLGVLRLRQVGNLAATLRATAWSGPGAVLDLLGLKL